MAIVDANLVMDMPKSLCAFGGLDAVTHALEAYVSVLASEFSDGQSLQALKLLKENLPASYNEGNLQSVSFRAVLRNVTDLVGKLNRTRSLNGVKRCQADNSSRGPQR
jgi:acetaldehyde dehydrogenase/alcohol dehydrogenase